MKVFRFADINVGILYEVDIFSQDQRSSLFEIDVAEESKLDIIFSIHELDMEELKNIKCLKKTGGFELLETKKGLFLLNHWGKIRCGYGIWLSDLYKSNIIPIYVNKYMEEQVPVDIFRFMGTVGLHSTLLMKKAPILHASYIGYRNKAILFSAPSGTGKSTQAELWKEYAGAEIINGDRVLLREKDDIWNAYGYPCCGSSNICENKTMPVAAIVVLQQGTNNIIEELTLGQKIRMLGLAMEQYLWETKEMELAFALSQELINKVPVMKLVCRPDAEAVKTLKDYLEEKAYV